MMDIVPALLLNSTEKPPKRAPRLKTTFFTHPAGVDGITEDVSLPASVFKASQEYRFESNNYLNLQVLESH